MSDNTKIEWTDATWPVVAGCEKVSPGCALCYAVRDGWRLSHNPNQKVSAAYAGTVDRLGNGHLGWTGVVRCLPERLAWPLDWKKPRKIFVCNQSDLFHDAVPDVFIDRVFGIMARCARHTFQILTKRPERMRDYMVSRLPGTAWMNASNYYDGGAFPPDGFYSKPLPNVWLGVSAEDQQRADERIPALLQTPAAVRFVSAEPLLGPIGLRRIPVPDEHAGKYAGHGHTFNALQREDDLTLFNAPNHLDWIIVGGESGAGARPCDVRWVRSIVRQCRSARVQVFVKQVGADVRDRNDAGFMGDEPEHWPEIIAADDRVEHDLDGTRDGYQGAPVRIRLRDRKGGDPAEWPEDLRVREMPRSAVPA